MSELFGLHPPKKRKIQTIFLGSFNASAGQSASTSTDKLRNVTPSPAVASSPLLALSSACPSSSSSSFVPSSRNGGAQFSPIRLISSSNRWPSDDRQNGCEIEDDQKNAAQLKRATNIASTSQNEGETAALLMNTTHSSVSMYGLEDSASLDGSATIATNGDEHHRPPPLPEMNSENDGAKLRSVPQMCHLQHNATKGLELPTPQPQKELDIRLKLGPTAQIDRIVVQNSLSNKRTLKSARILAKFGRDTKWQHIVPSPVLLIRSNRVWTVLSLEDKSLVVLHSQTGRVSCSLLTQSVLSLLDLRDRFCLAVSADATAQLWDLQCSRSLFRTSIRSLFGYSPDVPRIVHTFVSVKGLPVILLSTGDAFVFSLPLQSWLSFQIDCEFVASKLCAMQSIAKVLPDGLIAALLDGLKKSEKSSQNFVPQRIEIAVAKEEKEIEMLLRMTRELDSWEEFRLLAVIYTQLLLSRGKRAKLVEFLAELRPLSQTNDEFPFATIAADLRPLLAKEGEGGIDAEGLLGDKGAETPKRRERATTDGAGTISSAADRTLVNLLLAKVD